MSTECAAPRPPWPVLARQITELRRDEPARQAVATDFGRLVRAVPDAVVFPHNVADIARTFRFANRYTIPVALRGAGHCAGGLTLRERGIVIMMRSLDRILNVDASRRWVDVEAGATWSAVWNATLSVGLIPPVTVDWHELTVGGTLSSGGFGGQSFQAGLVIGHVLGLEIITSAGDRVNCSPSTNPEVFDLVRGGLGRVGAIVTARLSLIPAPSKICVHELYFACLADVLQSVAAFRAKRRVDAMTIIGLPRESVYEIAGLDDSARNSLSDRAAGGDTPEWIFRLNAGIYYSDHGDASAVEYPSRDDAKRKLIGTGFEVTRCETMVDFLHSAPPLMKRQNADNEAHPELALIIPEDAAPAIIASALREVSAESMGGGTVLIVPACLTERLTSLRLPHSDHGFLFSLLRAADSRSSARIGALTAHNYSLYERFSASGATHYPVDALPASAFERSTSPAPEPHFPALDPDGVLTRAADDSQDNRMRQ